MCLTIKRKQTETRRDSACSALLIYDVFFLIIYNIPETKCVPMTKYRNIWRKKNDLLLSYVLHICRFYRPICLEKHTLTFNAYFHCRCFQSDPYAHILFLFLSAFETHTRTHSYAYTYDQTI